MSFFQKKYFIQKQLKEEQKKPLSLNQVILPFYLFIS